MDVFHALPYNAHVFLYLLKYTELIASIFFSFDYTPIIYFYNSMIATSANNATGHGKHLPILFHHGRPDIGSHGMPWPDRNFVGVF